MRVSRASIDRDEAEPDQRPDDQPRGIEFGSHDAELRRARVGVVVVVEALAAGHPCEDARVVRRVVEVLPAVPVSDAVDERRHDEHVQQGVAAGHGAADRRPEENHQPRDAEAESHPAPREHQAVKPVLEHIGCETSERLGVARFAGIVQGVEQLHAPQPDQLGTVRVAVPIGVRVVLPVNRHPFAAVLSRGEPQHETEHDVRGAMHADGPMRQGAMEIHRGRDGRRLREKDGEDRDDPEFVSDGRADQHRSLTPFRLPARPCPTRRSSRRGPDVAHRLRPPRQIF